MTASKTTTSHRLPNAPLAEVVFELRWALAPAPPPINNYDPVLVPMLKLFTREMLKADFPHTQDLNHPLSTGPYGVVRRFFKTPSSPFPIMQLGAGIFAANDSVRYEWKAFKKQVLKGVTALLAIYPTDFGSTLHPTYLELRYVDLFGKSLVGTTEFLDFLDKSASLKFTLPPMLYDKSIFWGAATGRFKVQRTLRGRKDSLFIVDIGSGSTTDTKEDIVRMESKVTSAGGGVPTLKNERRFLGELNDWLEFAHSVTSPFFKQVLLPDVMKKFGVQRHGKPH